MYTLTARLPDVLARLRVIQVTATALALLVSALAIPAAASEGSLSGSLFEDTDRDGVRDAGETALTYVGIDLFGPDGRYLGSGGTGPQGVFSFTGLADGTYTVRVDSTTWHQLRDDWTPTNTGTAHLVRVVTVVGGATDASIGIRPISWSTALGEPVSAVEDATGLYVEVYNDAVAATTVAETLSSGSLIGEEVTATTVRLGLGSTSGATSFGTGGGEVSIDWHGWLDRGAELLFHEYGHVWANHFETVVRGTDGSYAGYLEARGLTGDPRLESSKAWQVEEMIAEDYRILFGAGSAVTVPHMNGEIPDPQDVAGLADYLIGAFREAPTGSGDTTGSGTTGASDGGTSVDSEPPSVSILAPTSGAAVSGTVDVVIDASDDRDAPGDLSISVSLGDIVTTASWDASAGRYQARLDTTAVPDGAYVVAVHASDAAGNDATASVEVSVSNTAPPSKGGGKGGGGKSGGGKGGPKR